MIKIVLSLISASPYKVSSLNGSSNKWIAIGNVNLSNAWNKHWHNAIAESKLGCKKNNFIIFTLGTGIGGGAIINGKLYQGRGNAGEFGSIILDDRKTFENLWKEFRKDFILKEEQKLQLILNQQVEKAGDNLYDNLD